ncbi:MAG: chorismate synthase [Planctomycetes bacterium]|nr:chorismate synthase [Planctomycetota bacterium]
MNSTGGKFIVTVFGGSHDRNVGCFIDGCPADINVPEKFIQQELDRRKPSKQAFSTKRHEEDKVVILSGIRNSRTTGGRIELLVENNDIRPSDYDKLGAVPRPGHADWPLFSRYGMERRGGTGQASGRMTVSMVLAGAIAKKILQRYKVRIFAYTTQIGAVMAVCKPDYKNLERLRLKNPLYCPDKKAAAKMLRGIESAGKDGDSLGGIIECVTLGLPVGTGEPFWDSAEGVLARNVFAIPAVKAIEFGAGFGVAAMRGSKNNDQFCVKSGSVAMKTNNSGGVLGGMTTGMPVVFRIAVKPTPSISREQRSVDIKTMKEVEIIVPGRHDVCIVPRAVPVVEAVTAITFADLILRKN